MDLPNQEFNQAVLQAIRIITEALGIETVAEFVETRGEFELLKKLGIDHGQGHFIAQPRATPYLPEEILVRPSANLETV